eukprot:GILJ01005218.1.p1 GENE.GILJ01005218.1~~GILJ01005218.1.p1  ORF type:complete len:296 (-),score=33.71 GILJ01005218.1:353-1240(-)
MVDWSSQSVLSDRPWREKTAFSSLWDALSWEEVSRRVPLAFSKSIRNRYLFANWVYLGYAIGIILIDFSGTVAQDMELTNRCYLGFAVLHVISAILYWWSWEGRSSLDIIMIPEYLNMLEAALYMWTAYLYPYQTDNHDWYTLTIHKIETAAAFVELFASIGWIMSWYMTYTRTLGRGFTLDDPDTVAYLCTTASSFVYVTYNIQILLDPDQYGENRLFVDGDIVYLMGAFFYIFAALRDDGWFWFLPLAEQYGIASGTVETEKPVTQGLPPVLVTSLCRSRAADSQLQPLMRRP